MTYSAGTESRAEQGYGQRLVPRYLITNNDYIVNSKMFSPYQQKNSCQNSEYRKSDYHVCNNNRNY